MVWDVTGFHTGGRQSYTYSLKAGQKRGMGKAHVFTNNIVINNYAPMPMHGGTITDWNTNTGMNDFEKWTLGIGAGLGVVGTILSALGLGGGGGTVEGAGGAEEEEKPKDDNLEKKYDEVSKKAAAQAKEIEELKAAAKAKAAADAEKAANTPKTDFTNGQTLRVHDEKLGTKADISGTITNNADGTISIKDVLNTYTYKKEANTVNYKGVNYPVYTLIGAVDSTTGQTKPITTQQYILVNGQLIQPSDLDMTGLGFGSVKKNDQ